MEFIKENLIKSPLNYVGGKFKLLPQILPMFPDEVNMFVDLFSGGANVGINVKAKKIICNDTISEVIVFCKSCKDIDSVTMVNNIESLIEQFQLSKTNQEGYLKLRELYNSGDKNWATFYTLVCYAFNNQIRFNSKGGYNMPFGKDRSSFNEKLKEKFIIFVNEMKKKNIIFTNSDFRKLKTDTLSEGDYIYADPPYLITTASYNENGGWSEKEEIALLGILDSLNTKKVKFGLSNVLESKGKSNDILKEWSKKYNVHILDCHYGNCNYQRKDKTNQDNIEVFITNY